MTREQFIKYVVDNNLTFIEARELIMENINNRNLYVTKINEFFNYNEILELELPDEKYYVYCDQLINKYKSHTIYSFTYGYEPNKILTCKNLVSYYVKFHKYKDK